METFIVHKEGHGSKVWGSQVWGLSSLCHCFTSISNTCEIRVALETKRDIHSNVIESYKEKGKKLEGEGAISKPTILVPQRPLLLRSADFAPSLLSCWLTAQSLGSVPKWSLCPCLGNFRVSFVYYIGNFIFQKLRWEQASWLVMTLNLFHEDWPRGD